MRNSMWRRRGRVLGTVTAALLCATVAGCTSTTVSDRTPNPSPSTSGGGVPVLLDTTHLRLPLDTYLPTLDEAARRSAAHRAAIRQCAERFGASITIPEPPHGLGLKSQNERRYGLTDAGAARKLGYGLGERDPNSQPDGTQVDLPKKSIAVLTGKGPSVPSGLPAGGCQGEAQRRLALVDPSTHQAVDENLAYRLSRTSFLSSQEDPRVTKAFADWASCMHAKGYKYEKPLDPAGDPQFQPPGSAKERRTAQDDVACKESTNLVGRWYAVESAYQTALIEENKTELAALARASAANKELVSTLI